MLPQCSGINCDGTALVHIISRFYHIDHCLSHWTAFYVTGDFRHFKMFRFWGFLAIFWCTWLWSASLISLIVTMWNWMMYAIMPLTLVQFLLHMWKMLKSSASYLCIVFCFFLLFFITLFTGLIFCMFSRKPRNAKISWIKLLLQFFEVRWFLATFAICCRPSICRLSVCRLSVTLVRPTQAVQIFGNISMVLGTLAIRWHPLKISRRSSQGIPSVEGVKHEG